MAADGKGNGNSNTHILQELEALSELLSIPHSRATTRRTASLSLVRTEVTRHSSAAAYRRDVTVNPYSRSRRMSLSQLDDFGADEPNKVSSEQKEPSLERRGIWNWKPIRALAHIGMQKLSCLLSIEVGAVRSLPDILDGLRLSVCVRKKESKDGSVQTMPSRVAKGAAIFEETLFMRCHVYFTSSSRASMKFEPRPFLIYVVAVDARGLDFGRSSVDLGLLIQESMERTFEAGRPISQWDRTFNLSGKAKGGEVVLKLGFQIMEKDGDTGIYSTAQVQKSGKSRLQLPSFARTQSKSSFSIPSSRMPSRAHAGSPTIGGGASDFQQIDDLKGSNPQPTASAEEMEVTMDENDLGDFDVEDKGIEIKDTAGEDNKEQYHKRSVFREVVNEVVQDQSHLAHQIKAFESSMSEEKGLKMDEGTGSQTLNAEEDKVTREFIQKLEDPQNAKLKINSNDNIHNKKLEIDQNEEKDCVPDLGKGLGCVIQTRDGGYLAAANPFGTPVARKDTPMLAMQTSKPFVIQANRAGFELFRKMAAIGFEELTTEILSLMPVDELNGKTAEQIAFEGIASAIIQGRKKEGASSSAARTIAAVKSMATAMNSHREDRATTGIWKINEEPLTMDEILASSMHKIETMAIDALKIQVDIPSEDAPFAVSPVDAKIAAANVKEYAHPLASAIPIENWIKDNSMKNLDDSLESETTTISVVVQLRDPNQQYEEVGGPMIALIRATGVANKFDGHGTEKRYRVESLHVGGVKVRTSRTKNIWDAEKQKLTALHWLVAHGIGKASKKVRVMVPVGPDLLWSISSRVMADTRLKPMRNPDVKFTK